MPAADPSAFGSDCAPSMRSVRFALSDLAAENDDSVGEIDFRSYHFERPMFPAGVRPGQ